jgi:hypothetical protein
MKFAVADAMPPHSYLGFSWQIPSYLARAYNHMIHMHDRYRQNGWSDGFHYHRTITIGVTRPQENENLSTMRDIYTGGPYFEHKNCLF